MELLQRRKEMLGTLKNLFPYSVKYILTCYALDVAALLVTVFVATSCGFDLSNEWLKVNT